jgi:MFS family permease
VVSPVIARKKIKKSLKASFFDGAFASCMVGFTTDYVTPYALALGASNRAIGMLSAATNLTGSLAQLKIPDITEQYKSRKKIITVSVFLQAFMLLPIMCVPFLPAGCRIWFLIIFATLFAGFGACAAPAWSSLMSEYIPHKSRGRYFGWRSKVLGSITVVAACCAGIILHLFKQSAIRGFLIIIGLAAIFRFISWYYLAQMYEPAFKVNREAYFSFFEFIKRIRHSNFAKFVFFVSSLTFCVNLAAPFFSVFMLRDLHFSYLTFTVIVAAVTVTNIFTIDRWGRHADKVGNLRVIRFTSFIIASLPLWWIFNRHPFYLIGTQVIAGFAWSGFNLCASNFIYDAVSPEKRTRCVAYFNVCNGIATCCGALCGGHVIHILPPLFGYKILTLFLMASLARFTVVCVLSHRIKEVRSAVHISSRELFYSVIGIKPFFGVARESRQLIREDE